MGDITSDNHRAAEHDAGFDRVLGKLGADFGHRPVEIDVNNVASVEVACGGVRKETSGVVLKLFKKDAFCGDFADHLSVCRA